MAKKAPQKPAAPIGRRADKTYEIPQPKKPGKTPKPAKEA